MSIRYKLLRFLLIFNAFACLIFVVNIFIAWESTAALLKYIGIKEVPEKISHPILEYWLLGMVAFYVVVGYLLLVAGINPIKYKGIVSILGYGLTFIGLVIGWHGFRLQIPPYPFYVDFGIYIISGPLIIWLAKKI